MTGVQTCALPIYEVRDALARLDAERLRGQYITVALMVVGLLAAVATLVVAWVAPS